MQTVFKKLLVGVNVLALALLTACGTVPASTAPANGVPSYDMVAAIHAAGDRETSVISVNPLRDPGIVALQDAANRDAKAGHYAEAATELDQAIKLSPESPDLLQDRAEMAVRLKDFAGAERFAHQSWSIGPKLGPLCARNWQTIAEMRLQAHDSSGSAAALKWVQQCHKASVPRY
ncbi:MAG: tetratricopeptide repeat protein [Rhodanobacter sp.]